MMIRTIIEIPITPEIIPDYEINESVTHKIDANPGPHHLCMII